MKVRFPPPPPLFASQVQERESTLAGRCVLFGLCFMSIAGSGVAGAGNGGGRSRRSSPEILCNRQRDGLGACLQPLRGLGRLRHQLVEVFKFSYAGAMPPSVARGGVAN